MFTGSFCEQLAFISILVFFTILPYLIWDSTGLLIGSCALFLLGLLMKNAEKLCKYFGFEKHLVSYLIVTRMEQNPVGGIIQTLTQTIS